MQRILIVSDTHRRLANLQEVLRRTGTPDRLIHLGDSEGQHLQIRHMAGCPADFVRGNCDSSEELPREAMIQIGRYRAFITHGHRYQVSFGPETLMEAGRARGADIVMFGHTHVPMLLQSQGITVLNPGSLTQPRQNGFAYTYILMEIDNDGEAHYTICRL